MILPVCFKALEQIMKRKQEETCKHTEAERRGRERREILRDSVWNDVIKHSIHGNKGIKISWLEKDLRIF